MQGGGVKFLWGVSGSSSIKRVLSLIGVVIDSVRDSLCVEQVMRRHEGCIVRQICHPVPLRICMSMVWSGERFLAAIEVAVSGA